MAVNLEQGEAWWRKIFFGVSNLVLISLLNHTA